MAKEKDNLVDDQQVQPDIPDEQTMEIVEIEEVKEEDNDIPITPGGESTLVI